MRELTGETVANIVTEQLARVSDASLAARIRRLLVPPYRVDREWDYAARGTTYPCWTVMEHPASGTGIAYCEQGFGPDDPWGLVFLSGEHMNIGMHCAWYSTLEDASRESMAWDDDATR